MLRAAGAIDFATAQNRLYYFVTHW